MGSTTEARSPSPYCCPCSRLPFLTRNQLMRSLPVARSPSACFCPITPPLNLLLSGDWNRVVPFRPCPPSLLPPPRAARLWVLQGSLSVEGLNWWSLHVAKSPIGTDVTPWARPPPLMIAPPSSVPLNRKKPVLLSIRLFEHFPPSRSRNSPFTPPPPTPHMVAPCLEPAPPQHTSPPVKKKTGTIAHGGPGRNRGTLDHSLSRLSCFFHSNLRTIFMNVILSSQLNIRIYNSWGIYSSKFIILKIKCTLYMID